MSSIIIRVGTDRKAALLAGRVLGETVDIEVNPETIGPEWPQLVDGLDMGANPPALHGCRVSDGTTAAVRAWLEERAIEREKRKNAAINRLAEAAKEREERAKAPMATTRVACDLEAGTWGSGPDWFDGWQRMIRLSGYYSVGSSNTFGVSDAPESLRAAADAREAELVRASEIEVDAANAKAFGEQRESLREAKRLATEQGDRDRAEAEAEANAAAEASFAERLKTGYWEMTTSSYNERRYGAPWCAKVGFESGPKPVYQWGESTGKWGKEGVLRVACKPGEVIAWGQKDLRKPGNSEHTLLRMRDNGSMEGITAAEAWEAHRKALATT